MDHTGMPWHFRAMATVGLIFYAAASAHFLVLWSGLGGLFRGVNPEFLTLVRSLAGWLTLLWALFAGAGLLGAWLLHLRNQLAPLFLFLAFACFALLGLWTLVFTRPSLLGIYGLGSIVFVAGVAALALLFWLYARQQRGEGLLEL